ncbi:unnamed protein product [Chrysoparadoxa australica]
MRAANLPLALLLLQFPPGLSFCTAQLAPRSGPSEQRHAAHLRPEQRYGWEHHLTGAQAEESIKDDQQVQQSKGLVGKVKGGVDWPKLGQLLALQTNLSLAVYVAVRFLTGLDLLKLTLWSSQSLITAMWAKNTPLPGASSLGAIATLPLIIQGLLLEGRFEWGEKIDSITQGLAVSLFGSKRRFGQVLPVSIALGAAAGIGEELMFRGALEHLLQLKLGVWPAMGVSAGVFGALHAVTPAYGILAAVDGAYFSWLLLATGNLAVPMISHALYDAGALCYTHWKTTKPTEPAGQEGGREQEGGDSV